MDNDDLEEDAPSELSLKVADMLMEDFSKTHNIPTKSYKDDVNYETLPYEFSVKITPKDNSLQVVNLIADDFLPSRRALDTSLEVSSILMDEEKEGFLPDVTGEYTHSADEHSFEHLDELSANMTKDQLYMTHDNAIDYSVSAIKNESDVSYLGNNLESRTFSSGLQSDFEIRDMSANDGDVLERICNSKREHIIRQKGIVMESKLRETIYSIPTPRGFLSAINSKIAVGQNALIAEIKKASPSRGVIRADFEPAMIAKSYEAGGATCISVLTDTPYFQGRDEYLNMVRRASGLPLLRKDFILDVYQVVESRALGADCILLIMAALNDEEAIRLEEEAIALGLDVLAEVHNEEELERALKLKTMLIGINNRDLKTLRIDLATTERLAPMVPFPRVVICESGIYSYEDIQRMNNSQVKTFLVGESLMVQDDIKLATERLLGNAF
jgi:indole-3-glycerol phosphate synthase